MPTIHAKKKVLDNTKWSAVYTIVAQLWAASLGEVELLMKTNSNITKRATMTASAVVRQPSALYQGTVTGRGACPNSLPVNPIGGGFLQGHVFRLEGVLRRDRRQDQNQI